ncbi:MULTISPECIES: hypothetical protein [unclassified Nostoc]|uniref:hypothetical protein n=1 Tax=unclassified Nostoc TaxID=2593658 RepID=UPI002622337F|nr:hypothetical protein [Nostoc sp. S13]MDF5740158.1 hypothetical protein [Nostoc sp. S13]
MRKSAGYWVALCLENGLVGQGINQEAAIKQLHEAIASFLLVSKIEPDIYHRSLTILIRRIQKSVAKPEQGERSGQNKAKNSVRVVDEYWLKPCPKLSEKIKIFFLVKTLSLSYKV